jgi:hypothetical protein
MYEFIKTFFGKNYDNKRDWFVHKTLIHFLPRMTFITIGTFFGGLLLFFGEFVALSGALCIFPFSFGLVCLVYLKVTFQVCSSTPLFNSPYNNLLAHIFPCET